MIHAYDMTYLDKACTAMSRMLDFAVYNLKYEITDLFNLFPTSGAAWRFERGDYALIVGMSGVELAYRFSRCPGGNRSGSSLGTPLTAVRNTGEEGIWRSCPSYRSEPSSSISSGKRTSIRLSPCAAMWRI